MENNTVTEWNDKCPEHGTEPKKEYDFGNFDATVVTFNECKCAVCHKHEDVLSDTTYYTSYTQAAGRAQMIATQHRVY